MLVAVQYAYFFGTQPAQRLSGRARRIVRPYPAPRVQPGQRITAPALQQPITSWKQLRAGRTAKVDRRGGAVAGGAAVITLEQARRPEAVQPVEVVQVEQHQAATAAVIKRRRVNTWQPATLQFGKAVGRQIVKESQGGIGAGGAASISVWGRIQQEDEDDLLNIMG